MPRYPWQRFRSAHASCVGGAESGVNYTSHHLRCGQLDAPNNCHSTRGQQKVSRRRTSRSWPGTAPPVDEEEESYSNVFTPQSELRYSSEGSTSYDSTFHNIRSAVPSIPLPTIRKPPRCRLPQSMKLGSLFLYMTIALLFLSSTNALPAPAHRAEHLSLHRRQAIPDQRGRTGNEPAPVKPQPPPQPATPSETVSVTVATTSSTTSTATSSSQPTTLAPNPNGNSNAPDNLGLGPGPRPTPLPVTSPLFPLSAGAIAGIAGGGVLLLCIIVGISICLYRRRRIDVDEIQIRRSKLGSRLAYRIFGEGAGSRAQSRRGSHESHGGRDSPDNVDEKRVEAGWLDKGTISRPKPAYLENGLLSVPKPGFVKEREKKTEDDTAPWVDKGTISAPRPGRPRSAEPLGRLSGMGLGMGYLK
ncbi:hypothetical protein EJ04DRAFT_580566 [Polyplosphaeria fusca]|uniref:Uncharacterized protein n=1 Tax=Polyplosphaeria fusca TaxID=682080 RepID=A0A9P4UY41_9PLEO|nr:hypothetical protein EJ04DRAFT_580566 [Polyplosphaeria fusca]